MLLFLHLQCVTRYDFFLLLVIKINEGADVIDLVVDSAEFGGQAGGGGSEGFLGQNRPHLSLHRSLLRL